MTRGPFILSMFLLLCLYVVQGCEFDSERVMKEGDVLLASVEDRKMFYSDIEGMIQASSSQDSIAQLNAYIEDWLARNVMIKEAEKKFSQDLDIDKLVDDYRSSLLLHNYRQSLIQEGMDTTITTQQELDYYEKNKNQYTLTEQICKARIVKIPDKARRIEQFYRNWKRNDSTKVNQYIAENAIFTKLDTHWHTVNHFLSYLPDSKFKARDFSKEGNIQKHDETFEYFIKVTDVRNQGEIAPLSYIRDQMRKIMINERKKELLNRIESKLYQSYLTANKINVYKN